jgi:pyridoxine/pyridoxamine 5'-phosphate oxidase
MAKISFTTTDEATRVRALPGFYNDLDGSLAHAWAMLGRGVADRRSAFHTPVVATIDETGAPSQRVMVLRAADIATRTLRLHTDLRSEKLVHIAEQPRVSLAFYDANAKLQLRLGAHACIHAQDSIADQAWLNSRPQSRLCYEQAIAPGAPVAAPLPELPGNARVAHTDNGRLNFAVLIIVIDTIEWLYLAIEGHRRARWVWKDDRWQGTWLAP